MSLIDKLFGAPVVPSDEGLAFRRAYIAKLRGDEELFDRLEEVSAERSAYIRQAEEKLRQNILAGQSMAAQRELMNSIVDQRRKHEATLVEMVILQSNIAMGRAWEKKWFDLGIPVD